MTKKEGWDDIAGWACVAATVAIALAGCATDQGPQAPIQVREVKVPVPVKCAVDPGPRPNYVDSNDALKAAADIFEQTKLLLAGRTQRIRREGELEAANAGCR